MFGYCCTQLTDVPDRSIHLRPARQIRSGSLRVSGRRRLKRTVTKTIMLTRLRGELLCMCLTSANALANCCLRAAGVFAPGENVAKMNPSRRLNPLMKFYTLRLKTRTNKPPNELPMSRSRHNLGPSTSFSIPSSACATIHSPTRRRLFMCPDRSPVRRSARLVAVRGTTQFQFEFQIADWR